MASIPPHHRAAVAAISAALSPYPWRRLKADLLARLVLAACDRDGLADLIATLPGCATGPWGRLEPVAPDDVRVRALVEFLAAHRWTELSLPALCGHLLAVPLAAEPT